MEENKNTKKNRSEDLLDFESIKPIFEFLLRNLIWIIIFAILFGSCAFALVKKTVDPKYDSQLKLAVSMDYIAEDMASVNTELSYTKSIIETYRIILLSNDYFDAICAYLDNEVSRNVVKSAVSVSVIDDTSILQIAVQTESAQVSYAVANAIAHTANDAVTAIDSHAIIKVVETPEFAGASSTPRMFTYIALGVLLGIMLGIAVCIIREMFIAKVHSESELKAKYNISILSSIPDFE